MPPQVNNTLVVEKEYKCLQHNRDRLHLQDNFVEHGANDHGKPLASHILAHVIQWVTCDESHLDKPRLKEIHCTLVGVRRPLQAFMPNCRAFSPCFEFGTRESNPSFAIPLIFPEKRANQID